MVDLEGGRLRGVRMAGGEVVPRRALAIGTRLEARADLLANLGLQTVEHSQGVGSRIEADATGPPPSPVCGWRAT